MKTGKRDTHNCNSSWVLGPSCHLVVRVLAGQLPVLGGLQYGFESDFWVMSYKCGQFLESNEYKEFVVQV